MHTLTVLPLALLISAAQAQTKMSCAALAHLTLPHTTILRAEQIDPGVTGTMTPEIAADAASLPSFCRVTAQLTPSADSDIHMELWLPLTWNKLFRGQGNGGFAGSIDYGAMSRAAAQGYATAGTDTGHTAAATDAAWALRHPEKIADFGYRAIHEMTATSQLILQAFYGAPARHSFFAACSDGGREALMEAQRFPADYDGIIAGAPAYNWTALLSSAIAAAQALSLTPESYLPSSKLPAISAAALTACDARDGLKDGILTDPRACRFDPAILLCKQGDTDSCLTGPQLKTLQSFYAGVHAADGTLIEPGYLPGSELGSGGWSDWITGKSLGTSELFKYGHGFFANMVYNDPNWNFKTASVEAAFRRSEQTSAADLDATNPNLAPFFSHGGKLILYHGWNDPAIPALGTLDYISRMSTATPNAAASTRLYMVPGMQHCGGGPGATSFGQFGWFPGEASDDPRHDLQLALEQWVEHAAAPANLIATRYQGTPNASPVVLTRPLCAYPEAALYNGKGDPSAATSFTCKAPM